MLSCAENIAGLLLFYECEWYSDQTHETLVQVRPSEPDATDVPEGSDLWYFAELLLTHRHNLPDEQTLRTIIRGLREGLSLESAVPPELEDTFRTRYLAELESRLSTLRKRRDLLIQECDTAQEHLARKREHLVVDGQFVRQHFELLFTDPR